MTECKKNQKRLWLLSFYLMIFAVLSTSCTKDYFEDESNFSIYVPQIERGEIQNFYIAFYDVSGRHVRTRQHSAPFNGDNKIQSGIMRFKLPAGTYTISCFADYIPNNITLGEDLSSSAQYEGVIDQEEHIYGANNSNPRMVFKKEVAVVPLGVGSDTPYEINIDESTCFKGKVTTEFIDLPSNITRIDMLHKNISSRVSFGGYFGLFNSEDCVLSSASVADMSLGGSTRSNSYLINPSVGLSFPATSSDAPLNMSFEVSFYNGSNLVGVSSYPATLGHENPPVYDAANNLLDISNLVLHPKQTMRITFKNFVITKIRLIGWGEIEQGETTPI